MQALNLRIQKVLNPTIVVFAVLQVCIVFLLRACFRCEAVVPYYTGYLPAAKNNFLSKDDFLPSKWVEPKTSTPVYWINAPWLTERARDTRAMLEIVGLSGTRINGRTPDNVQTMMLKGQLQVNCTLISKCIEECWRHRYRDEYTFSEVALVLGHIAAIQTAYNDGHDMALIIEDDIELFPELPSHLPSLFANAPPEWEVLQINVKNVGALQQFANIRDSVVGWQREYFGTGAYVINKRGMQSILSQFAPEPNRIVLPDSPVSDWLVYRYTRTYVSTRMLTNLRKVTSTLQNDRDDVTLTQMREAVLDNRQENLPIPLTRGEPSALLKNISMMAITTIRGDLDKDMVRQTVQLLKENVVELRQFGAVWYVWIIIWPGVGATKYEWEKEIWNQPELASNLDLRIEYRVWKHAFPVYNKFHYYAEVSHELDKFDFVLMHDNDMKFVGFPWTEFFHRLLAQEGKALVSGVVRRSEWPKLHLPGNPSDSYFKYMDARHWQSCNRGGITHMDVEYVEQWFTVLTGSFMRLVTQDLVMQVHHGLGQNYSENEEPDLFSAWGPDLLWCRAALAQGGKCVIFPLAMKHMNWKTLTANVDVQVMGKPTLAAFRELRPEWIMRQHVFDLWGHARCKSFRESCQIDHSMYYSVSDENLESLPKCAVYSRKPAVGQLGDATKVNSTKVNSTKVNSTKGNYTKGNYTKGNYTKVKNKTKGGYRWNSRKSPVFNVSSKLQGPNATVEKKTDVY